MLIGIVVYVNEAAIICALVALPLFIGTTRQRLLDKNNLLGLALLGLAAFTHGGFQTVIRSSPHAVFSGYVLGWDGGSEDDKSSLWIYDLGFPPAPESSFINAPYRNLYVTWSRTNNVPPSFWNSDTTEHVTCEYRSWDLQITHIDAVPVPNAKQAGSAAWHWISSSQGRSWSTIEALLGLLVVFWATLKLASKPATTPSAPLMVRQFPNRWATRVYIAAAALVLGWIVFVRVSDRIFQFRAQSLLESIQQVELRKSTWQDAQRIMKRNNRHVSTDASCSQMRCDITIMLDHWYKFLSSGEGNSRLGRFAWTAWRLSGGRWAFINAALRVRDGVVWGKDFDATISHRDDYPLIATADTTRDFATRSWYVSQDAHPNVRFGRPGGCEICQALWVKVTPFANPKEMQDAFAFDLACIGGTLRRCTEMSQIMPVAARRLEEDSRANDVARPTLTWSPAMIRALARDARSAAVVEILRVYPETSDEPQSVDYKVVATLKGGVGVPIQRVALSRQPTVDVRKLPRRAIVFGFERNDNPAFVTLADDNLREARAGIAEDSVDIPQKW